MVSVCTMFPVLMKKNSCMPIDPKKYSCYGLKKIHTRNLITKKYSYGSKIPLPPLTFLMVRPLSPASALSCFASSDWLISVSAKLLIGRVIHLVLFTRVKMFFTDDKFPKFLACCFVYFHHLFRFSNSKNYFYHFLG